MTYRDQVQAYEALEAAYGKRIADAFMAAIQDLKTSAEFDRLEKAIQARDLNAAIDALHLDPAAFNAMLDEIRAAFIEGGTTSAGFMPDRRPDGAVLRIRFNGRNPAAEAWLAQQSSALITRITKDTQDGVRAALTAAMANGQGPRAATVDIVGRMDPATGKRVGGLLGLSKPQIEYVENARRQLASSDPADLQAYLGRAARSKTFDPAVKKAIRDGKPIPAETQRKALNAYQTRMEGLRAETIGRVEAMTALQVSKRQSYLQAIADGKFTEDEITRIWRSADDFRVRLSHAVLDDKQMPGMTRPFVSITGSAMRCPMDTSLGAKAADIIGCRCDMEYRINWLGRIKPAAAPAPRPAPAPPPPVIAAASPAPPAPVRLPDPAPAPVTAGYATARLPTTVAEAQAYIRAAGIAATSDLTGMPVKNIAEALRAARETVERFGLDPLDFIGPIGRWENGFRKVSPPRNANAAIFTGTAGGRRFAAFHMPTKFADKRDAANSAAMGERASPKYTEERDAVLAQRRASNLKTDPGAEAAVASIASGRYGWSASSLSGEKARAVTTYHEFGHVLHMVDRRIGPEIDGFLRDHNPRKGGWQFALSRYAGANDKEYVAEAFAIYMSAPAEHVRIHPALLSIFRKYDNANRG